MSSIPMPWPSQEELDKGRMHKIAQETVEKTMVSKPTESGTGYTTRTMQPEITKVASPETVTHASPDADEEEKSKMVPAARSLRK